MKNKPLVSVIMPFYNAATHIEAALLSIFKQTYDHIEVILVNDASTDASIDTITHIISSEKNVQLLHNESNLGLAASLNIAIQQASGMFIARMDADDIMDVKRIERQVNFLSINLDVDILGGSLQYFGQSEYYNTFPLNHELCMAHLCFNVCFGHPAVMFRSSVFNDSDNYYNNNFKQYSEEYDLWCRLSFKYKFANLKETLIYYRTYSVAEKKDEEALRRENSKGIRSIYLTKVFKDYDRNHLILHHKISRYSLEKIEQIHEAHHYFNYLLQLESKINKDALQIILAERFFDLCYANIHLGRKIHWIYLKNKYWRHYQPSLSRYIKFMFKTIIKL